MLQGKRIIVGITGSIAAYKAILLVRELVTRGADVQVVMTPSAREFVTPLTLATLSGKPVIVDMFDGSNNSGTWHIDLGVHSDAMIIAPASANTIAKIAAGFADTALTSLVLALRCPLVIAPAMDVDMYRHPATQENLSTLRHRGVRIIDPEEGELASGLVGIGRLPEPSRLVEHIESVVSAKKDFTGTTLLVTAGPTRESLDPVRFLTNHSSGKMGYALAMAARDRGANVVLVSGPTQLPAPAGVALRSVTTAAEMFDAAREAFATSDVAIFAAAVADFTPVNVQGQKIKKKESAESYRLECKKTVDILATLSASKGSRTTVGFALETENLLDNARKKLTTKNADFIVANDPTRHGAGFNTDSNIITVLRGDGAVYEFGAMTKREVADVVLDLVRSYRDSKLHPLQQDK